MPIQEIWQQVADFPGYEVSDQGRVRSYWKSYRKSDAQRPGFMRQIESTPQRMLKPNKLKHGYLQVTLFRDGVRHYRTIHRLVLTNFVGPCPPGLECCHKDGTRSHCWLTNLRWDTKSANSLDSVEHGTHRGLRTRGAAHPCAKLSDQKVRRIKTLLAHGFLQRDLATFFNVGQQAISRIANRKNWAHI